MIATEELGAVFAEAAYALGEYREHPYGPEVTPEMHQAAGEAFVRIRGGNPDEARTAWKLIVDDLGYMPRAVVLASLRLASTNLVPDIEAPEPQ